MFTGVVYATAAAQLMKMIYVSRAHRATDTAKTHLASSRYHNYVSLHLYQAAPLPKTIWPQLTVTAVYMKTPCFGAQACLSDLPKPKLCLSSPLRSAEYSSSNSRESKNDFTGLYDGST